MSSSESRAQAPERMVAGAALLSWSVPLLAMTVVGFSEQGEGVLGVSRSALTTMAELAAVLGLLFGAGALVASSRGVPAGAAVRQAILGTAGSLSILLMTEIAAITGAVSGTNAELMLGDALRIATHDYGGWNGGTRLSSDATLHVVEIDGNSEFAKTALEQYGRPYRIALLGVDNREGTRDLTVGLEGARTVRPDGAVGNAVLHPEAGSAAHGLSQPGALHVPKGDVREGAIVLFPPGESFRDVRAVELAVDGRHVRIPGRYFTLAEKRAIDAARNGPKSP